MNKLIIPNAITLLNILSGTLAIYFALTTDKLYIAGLLVLLASLFDFFDGFVARLLNAQSEFGKQMDSLADLISFGLAPTFIMLSLISNHTNNNFLPFLSFFIISFSAIRLAIFNITDQKTEFQGLATPAFAILVASLAISFHFPDTLLNIETYSFFNNIYSLLSITIVFSILLVTNIPMFSFKFKNFSFSKNKTRYTFIILSIILIAMLYWSAIPFIITIYILFSLIKNNSITNTNSN
ncbi:MAG: CDP-diacylglycerol--serine O-phosphatidyltransferase [Bacteroidota bacterium]|nr:CDP-diacylglycerol--serine O-phosphatidyltransferase [Bacteroidota bacterium]